MPLAISIAKELEALEKPLDSFEEFSLLSTKILMLLKERYVLGELARNLLQDRYLFSLSEHYDILDKLVLYSSQKTGIRLRLHLFANGYFDRPHNHRWSYSSYILSGAYKHTIYNLNNKNKDPIPDDLFPVIIRREKAGDLYTLHHSQYHSVVAENNTVTLVLRGPSEQERFRVMDNNSKEAWWQYGAEKENQQERASKQISYEQLSKAIEKLTKLDLII